MSIPALVPIVEGHSEVQGGIRYLLQKIVYECREYTGVQIAKPFRVKRDQVVNRPDKLASAIKSAAISRLEKGFTVGAILILLDAERQCPVELSSSMTDTAKDATQLPVGVVLARRMIENWVLASKESLRGVCGIHANATAPPDPESMGPLGHLSENMEEKMRYNKTRDLPALLAKVSIELCEERCHSFRKLMREIDFLVAAMRGDS